MKNTIKTLTALAILVILSSFTQKNTTEFIGTYGVSNSNPAQIKLTINADQTFYYQDFSVPDKKIMVNGTWLQKGNKVILKDSNPSIKFHNVWKFESNGKIAKSRKGLTYYRLGKEKE